MLHRNYTPEEMQEIGECAIQAMREFGEACWKLWDSLSTEQQIERSRIEGVSMPVRGEPDYPDWLT